MKKYLVLYYSKTGNSKFLAKKLSGELGCDLREISPAINSLILLFLLSLMKISIATKISRKDIEEYDEVIILGPIWGGLLISPLRSALKKCLKASKTIHFAVSCETSDEEKNDKFGYAQVLREAEKIGANLVKTTEAFSTALVKDKKDSPNIKLSEKTMFTNENFKGMIVSRFEIFVERVKAS